MSSISRQQELLFLLATEDTESTEEKEGRWEDGKNSVMPGNLKGNWKLVCWFCTKDKLGLQKQEFCINNDIYFSSADQVEQLVVQLRKSLS